MGTKKTLHILLVFLFVTVAALTTGCGQKTTRTSSQVDQTNWEWVPRVWVEDNSLAGRQYDRCSFDESTVGYWCPPGTK